MNSDIILTLHARERLNQRSSESIKTIRNIIAEEKYVKIGQEAGSDRQHFLFYSILDFVWHILVIDVNKKQIITILPVDFHENISWTICHDSLEKAKHLALGTDNSTNNKSSVLRIQGLYFTNNYPKRFNLGSWPFNHNLELNMFDADEDFWATIKARIKDKKFLEEDVEKIYLRRGKSVEDEIQLDLPFNK